MPVYSAQGEQIVLGREVGQGHRARVYLVRHRPDQVAKLLRDPPSAAEAERLQALARHFTPELEAVAAWPVGTLHDHQGALTGYVRPFLNLGDYRELPHLYSPALRLKAFPRADWAFMARVAAQVAQAFAALHRHGQVMGDVSGLNVMVSSQGRVKLVNVDSYQVSSGAQVYPTPVTSAECLPPELQEQVLDDLPRSADHDLFGLAVLAFLLLFDGHHPYAGVPERGEMPSPARAIATHQFAYAQPPRPGVRPPPETLALSALPAELQHLFQRAFAPSGEQRPSAQEWAEALNAFAAALVPCEQDALHQHLPGQACPWCELAALRQVSPFLGELPPDQSLPQQVEALWQQAVHVSPPLRTPVIPETKGEPLPDLSLGLPTRPNAMAEAQKERVLRWALRLVVVALLMAATMAVQRSVLAGLVVPAILILAFTVGRRLSVDWDSLIEGYQNWEGKLTERLLPARGQWQTYHQALGVRRSELAQQVAELKARRVALEERYAKENAHAEYQRDFAVLEEQRRVLLQGQERQGQAVEHLLMQRRQQALDLFLKRQPIRANILPGLTSRVALQLATQGLRTAYDLHPAKLENAPEDWVSPLLLWRQQLEDFLPVSADLVSTQQVQEVRQNHAEHLQEQLAQFERAVNRFKNASWGQHQGQIVTEYSEVRRQQRQLEQGLKTLEKLSVSS